MTVLSSRRRAGTLSVLLSTALILTACGESEPNDENPEGDGAADAEQAAEDSESSQDGDFPVTVDTPYGEITVEEKPERIVAIVGPYADMLVALEEEPVAYVGASRIGDDFFEGYPWLDEDDLNPEGHDLDLLAEGYAPSLETIASYEPDLILGEAADWAIDEQMYEELSRVAPTYTNPHAFGEWDQTLSDLAELTGTVDQVPEVVETVETAFTEARERLPGLQGATFITADPREGEIGLGTDRFLYEELGLEPDTELAEQESVSEENLDELTADVVEFFAWRGPTVQEDLESDPRFEELPAVQNDTVIWADGIQVTAVDAGPASIQWWLDEVVPQLEDSELNTEGQ